MVGFALEGKDGGILGKSVSKSQRRIFESSLLKVPPWAETYSLVENPSLRKT